MLVQNMSHLLLYCYRPFRKTMREVIIPLVLAAVLLVQTYGQTMNHQTCNREGGHRAIIQPEADAFIAGFFSFHLANDNGVGCGEIRTSGM